MKEDEKEVFKDIYVWLNGLMQDVHKGCMVDQETLMCGTIRLYINAMDNKRREHIYNDGI